MDEVHILRMLKEQKRRHLSFHTPGHKRAGADITELSYSDNLSNPRGVIKEAEEDIAKIVGARESFLLTDGSTSGVFSMLYAFKSAGAKSLAIPRFSHPCVYHAAKVMGIELIFLEQSASFGLNERISREEILRGVRGADALFLTSPDYYGFIPDLAFAKEVCKEEGKPLLIDGAHGSHLHFAHLYAGNFADMWVDGAHKSLPALTQGALVHAKNDRWAALLREGVSIFRTTSPSYPIMASVEYAMKYPQNKQMEALSEEFKMRHGCVKNDDWTKLVVPFGCECDAAQRALEERGIYPEFNDGNYLLFYLSPCTKEREIKTLAKTLEKLPRGKVEIGAPLGVIPMYGGEKL